MIIIFAHFLLTLLLNVSEQVFERCVIAMAGIKKGFDSPHPLKLYIVRVKTFSTYVLIVVFTSYTINH